MNLKPQVVPEPKDEDRKSAVTKAIEALNQNRATEEIEIAGYFTLGEKGVPNILVRVPTKWEQDRAIDLAHAYAKKVAGEGDARKDDDILADAKSACIAWYACRDAEDPKYHAFPSSEWMAKNLSAEQIGTLVRLVNGVRAKFAPTPLTLDSETLDRMVAQVAEVGATDLPERALAGWPREMLVHAWVLLCMRTASLEDECKTMREELARLREGGHGALEKAIEALTNAGAEAQALTSNDADSDGEALPEE